MNTTTFSTGAALSLLAVFPLFTSTTALAQHQPETITGLAKGGTYRVRARTRYRDGVHEPGPWSDEVRNRLKDDPPTAPTGLSVAGTTHARVTLPRTEPSSGPTSGYRITRGPDAAKLTTIVNDTGSTGTRYTNGTFPEQTTHHCAVVALSAPTAAEPRPPRTAARQCRTTGRHGTAGRQRNAREKTPASRNAMQPETGHP